MADAAAAEEWGWGAEGAGLRGAQRLHISAICLGLSARQKPATRKHIQNTSASC